MSRKSRFRRSLVDQGNNTWFVDLEKAHGIPMPMSFEIAGGNPGTGPARQTSGMQSDNQALDPVSTGGFNSPAARKSCPPEPGLGRIARRRLVFSGIYRGRSGFSRFSSFPGRCAAKNREPECAAPEPEPGGTPQGTSWTTMPPAPVQDNRRLGWHRLPLIVFGLLAALAGTLLSGLGMSCVPGGSTGSRQLSLMTWNLQNLFDSTRDGGEYTEFTPPAWTFGAYRKRLETFASILALLPGASIAGSGTSPGDEGLQAFPHLMVFQELENRKVLQDLATAFATEAGSGFPYTWLDTCPKVDDSPVTMGVLAWKTPVLQRSHRVWVDGSSSRLVWELHFDLDPLGPAGAGVSGETADSVPRRLVLFANHWKSKSGDAPDAEALRLSSARVVRERTQSLMNDGIPTVFVCTGDLNTQGLAGESGQDHQALLALHDWDGLPTGTQWLQAGKGSRSGELCLLPPVWSNADADGVSRLWEDSVPAASRFWTEAWCARDPGSGTYFYDGNWERIDHILARSSLALENPAGNPLSGLRIEAFGVPAIQGLADQNGLPRRYQAATGTGVSDHLPLVLRLGLD